MGNARGNDITFTFEETRLFFVQIGAHANCDKYHAQSSTAIFPLDLEWMQKVSGV